MTPFLIQFYKQTFSDKAAILYSNDGSAMSGVGSYVVQSMTINGSSRTLPTFGIVSEARESLSELELSTLEILSAASGGRYTPKQLFERIEFRMSDSTAHNLKVGGLVAEKLASDHQPTQLLCNIHPLMMFQNAIKKVCQDIHAKLGKKKINECFIADVDFANEGFIIKAMKCMANFVSKEYSAKPWNRFNHFTAFIHPRENFMKTLKDHRFNLFMEVALIVLHHMDDVKAYLFKFDAITNGIAILDRSFVEMEVLKPIFAAIALIGIHITKPFERLLMDQNTDYSTLLEVFPKLYVDLTELKPERLLLLTRQASFIDVETFEAVLPKPALLDTLPPVCIEYRAEIVQILGVFMRKMAEGWDYQKGALFGFGPSKDKATQSYKVAAASQDELKRLNTLPVHNIQQERNVGDINYELEIRGKNQLPTASRKLVLKNSADLWKPCSKVPLSGFKSRSVEIKDIKDRWDIKMKELEGNKYEAREQDLLKRDKNKLEDLTFLKSQPIQGPFTEAAEVDLYMETALQPETEMTKRLMTEVRY